MSETTRLSGKRERFLSALNAFRAMRCPLCGSVLVHSVQQLRCANRHSFAINRKGCVNFLTAQATGCYTDLLFAARRRVFASGCYQPVVQALLSMLSGVDHPRLLDAGCGDGWYLQQMLQKLPDSVGAGIDLSKDAILQATDWSSPAVWCVGDLRNLPFADGAFDAVLDILTPANYAEFKRVLKPDGILLKVYPGHEYLKQLRMKRGMALYEEGQVGDYLQHHGQVKKEEHVLVHQKIDENLWRDFVYMTPLNQDLSDTEKEQLAIEPQEEITIDLHISACVLNG